MSHWTDAIPWIISSLLLVVSVLTLINSQIASKDKKNEKDTMKFDGIKESLLKANMKLDQVCATTNETRSDIKSLNRDVKEIDRRVSLVERDLKTAFIRIDELKESERRQEHE